MLLLFLVAALLVLAWNKVLLKWQCTALTSLLFRRFYDVPRDKNVRLADRNLFFRSLPTVF